VGKSERTALSQGGKVKRRKSAGGDFHHFQVGTKTFVAKIFTSLGEFSPLLFSVSVFSKWEVSQRSGNERTTEHGGTTIFRRGGL